jgi:hypothetical protein
MEVQRVVLRLRQHHVHRFQLRIRSLQQYDREDLRVDAKAAQVSVADLTKQPFVRLLCGSLK